MGFIRKLRRLARKKEIIAAKKFRRKAFIEPLEPRLLLSADLNPDVAVAAADGLDLLGDRVETFLDGESLFDTHVPFITQIQQEGDEVKNTAPTIGELFSVNVDFDGDGNITGDEVKLQALDKDVSGEDGYGTVDAGEFIQGWFFDELDRLLRDDVGSSDPDTYNTAYLGAELSGYTKTLTDLGITLTIGTINDLSPDGLDNPDTTEYEHIPQGEVAWYIPFTLTAEYDLAIDLGLDADALKLVLFDDSEYDSYGEMITPTIPVTATIDFGFTFGVNTGGQETTDIGTEDFFVRSTDNLDVRVYSDATGLDPYINIGFLGAEVNSGEIHLQMDVETELIDPNSPSVLGFDVVQYGVRDDTGIITADNPIPSADLAHDAQFTLRIGNLGMVTEVTVIDDNNNEDLDDLLDDVNAALATAGLEDLITASLIDTDSDTFVDTLQFSLISTTETPFGFTNESIGLSGTLSATPDSGDATYPYEFASDVSFLLSVGGDVPKLVNVVFPDTAQTELGFDDSQNADLADLVAESSPSAYVLTDDATFSIYVRKDDGSLVHGSIALTPADTAGNTDYYYLADDIYYKIGADPELSGLLAAVYDGANIKFVPLNGTKAISVYAYDTAQTEIGFAWHQTSTLALTAVNTPIGSFDLSADAHLNLTISYDTGTEKIDKTVTVTIPADLNSNANDLAADINTAIDTELGVNKVDVEIDTSTGKIVLKANDTSVYALSISTINTTIDDLVADVNSALQKAGLTTITASADGTNLILTEDSGKTLEITKTLALDAGFTYTELQQPDPDEPGGDPADGTATADLFNAEPGEYSEISFKLPVSVLPGLIDANNSDYDYNPEKLAIVGNFDPFGNYAQDGFDDAEERFLLELDVNPDGQSDEYTELTPIDIPDPFSDPPGISETIQLVNFAEPLNFNMVTAESMIGLLMSLGTALQEMAASGLFAGYDIPFADAAWSDLLNFSDPDKSDFSGLIDRALIYETGGNGIDPYDVASGDANDADRLLKRIVVDEETYLIPNFVTAQEMASTLSNILDVPAEDTGIIKGINATYDWKNDELTYYVDLVSSDRTNIIIDDAAFEYDVDLGPFAKMTLYPSDVATDLVDSLTGYTGLKMTFGIDMTPPGAVIYEDDAIKELNGGTGVDIKLEEAVTGETGVRSILSDDAGFYIRVSSDYGANWGAWSTFTIDKEATYDNKTTQNFAEDINDAFAALPDGHSLKGYVWASVLDGKLALNAIGGATTLQVYAGNTGIDVNGNYINTAWTELGFSTSVVTDSSVLALKAPTPMVGRLTGDATFAIDIDGDANGPYWVTVNASATEGTTTSSEGVVTDVSNVTMSDLVADVNNALAATDIGNELGFTSEQSVELEPIVLLAYSDAQTNLISSVTFYVAINGDPAVEVTVAAGDYGDMATLTTAVNSALTTAGLDAYIAAEVSEYQVALHAVDTSVSKIDVTAGVGNALGFGVSQTEILGLTGTFNAQLELDDDVILTVMLDGGAPVEVTVASGTYADMDALITAVDSGLTAAGLDGALIAEASGDRISLRVIDASIEEMAVEADSTFLSAYVKADYDNSFLHGSRLVLTALDQTTHFSVIAGADSVANDELGLPDGTTDSDQTDFIIVDRTGAQHRIVLDGLDLETATVLDLMNLIDTQTYDDDLGEGAVKMELNGTHTGLRLVDNTEGTGKFRVETVNGSGALLQLGFLNELDNPTKPGYNPDYIEGGPIGLTHLDDRFFVRNAELWGALKMKTPNTVDPGETVMETQGALGSALFGIVGVDTYLSGKLYAEFTADIKDPDNGVAGGTATLLELFEGAKQGRLSNSAHFNVTVDGTTTTVTVPKWDTLDVASTPDIDEANETIDDLVADVNKALHDAGLDTKILARASGTRIEFVSLVEDNPMTVLNEAAFTITPDGGIGAAELGLGLSGMLSSSENEDGEQVIAAAAASRYAIDDPVVTTASELSYYTGIAPFTGGFTQGQVVIGYDVVVTYDGDGNPIHTDFIETGRAIILENEYDGGPGVLTLGRVEGAFNDADWLVTEGYTAYALHSPGEATPKANFGEFNLHVVVQPGFDDVGFGDGFSIFVLGGGNDSFDVPFTITDFGNPYDPVPPEADLDLSDIGDMASFEYLDYEDLSAALEGLLDLLEDVEANFDLLTTPLPAINRSVSYLLSLVNGFARGVDNMNDVLDTATLALDPGQTDLPALTLQDIPQALRGAFGLPDDIIPGSGTVDWVMLDFDDGDTVNDPSDDMLLMDLILNETITTKLGLDIELLDEYGNPILDGNDEPLPNLTSGGVLKVSGELDLNLHAGIDLYNPEDAYLFDTSTITGNIHVEGEGQEYANGEDGVGLVFRASLGPLAVFIQDGDALMDVAFELKGLDFGEGIHKKLITDPNPANNVRYSDFKTIEKTSDIDIVLPMFFGGEGPNDYIGDFEAYGNLDEGLAVETPEFQGIVDAIDEGELVFDPFDNILLAFDTLNFYLESLSDILADEMLGINLPFVGDQLADVLFIETFRYPLYSTLKSGIENDIDPTPEDVTTLLETALAGYLVSGSQVLYTFNMVGDVNTWYRQWNFTIGKKKTYLFDDFDLGIDNLGFDVDVPVSVEFEWKFDIGFGVNFVEGAYIDVADTVWTGTPEKIDYETYDLDGTDMTVDIEITIPDLAGGAEGSLGFLPLTVTDPNNDTGATINFKVDIQNSNASAPDSGRLGFSDLGNIDPVAVMKGGPLDGATDAVTLHLNTRAILGLPSLRTDLVMNWSLLSTDTNDPDYPAVRVGDLEGDAVTPGIHMIALNDMFLDAKSVAQSLLGPLFEDIADFIEPFMPVVDILTYAIPILSDVAGEPFTLLDLAAIFGSVDPSFIEAVADILDVITMVNDIINLPELPLGSIVLFSDSGNPNAGFIPNDPDNQSDLADIVVKLTDMGDAETTPGWNFDKAAYDAAINSSDFLKKARDGELADGLTLPIFTDARQGVMLLLDQNAVMIDYIIPPLSVEFEYLQVFPVYPPLSVSIEISFGFTVDMHSVGFDTYGYQRYADGGFRNEAVILDGVYFNDLNAEGVDAPEVLFEFGLVGAAELNLGIARGGVGGGINAQIYFDWCDSVPDGRVHISEMAGNILANSYNPIAVFDVGGALTFQLFAFIEISIIGFELEIPITPETELFSFEIPFERPPILATQAGDTLFLNIGPNAEDRLNGNTSDGHEGIEVNMSGGTVQVTSDTFGVTTPQEFSGISHIIGIGGQGNDSITLNLGTSGITYELEGGAGDDTITVTGGGGGTIRGGVGNDILKGGAGDDIIWGEEGNDEIYGFGGYDTLFGDFGRVFENVATADPLVTSRITEADGDDEIYGGEDDDIIIGAGGDDRLYGEGGDDLIIGDGGRFAYDEIDGHFDIIAITGTDLWLDPDDPGQYVYPYMSEVIDTNDPTDPAQISTDIDKIYDAMMATFSSTDLGFGGNDEIYGGEGGDIIIGGTADDFINGDAGDDLILGGKGFDEIYGGTKEAALGTVSDKDTIFGGDQADTIYGSEDDDVISGGAGNDYIHGDNQYGNEGDDVIKGDSGADVLFGDAGNDQVFGQTEPDVLFGGAGNDLVVGGTGADIMFGDDGVVAKLDKDGSSNLIYSKVIYNTLYFTSTQIDALLADVQDQEGAYIDTDIRTIDLIQTYVVETDGNDFLSGDAGDDIMLGGGGNDLMGGDVDPRLIYEGIERPTEISEDVLIGDGGRLTFFERRYRSIETVYADTSTWTPGTYEFVDTIYGDNGNDYIFGGQDGDILAGGHGPDRGPTDLDPYASDNDVIIGDNGELLFADKTIEDNFGRLELIRTTDEVETTGGADTVYGEEGADVILGGVNNGGIDKLYGDYYDYDAISTPPITVGNDVILGDNGELDFALGSDTNLDTLDLIRSYRDGLGGGDWISGSQGYDVLIGGTAGDMMYGDDEFATNGNLDGEDIMLGDNGDIFLINDPAFVPDGEDDDTDIEAYGRLLVRVTDMAYGTTVDLITTTDKIDLFHLTKSAAEACGGPDTMSGNAGNDIMLGGVNNDDGNPLNGIEKDVMYGDQAVPTEASIGNDADDILIGDNGLLDFTYDTDLDRNTLDLIRSKEDGLGGVDIISGNKGLDVAIGGTGGDEIFGDDTGATAGADDKGDLLLGDNADIFLVAKGTDTFTGFDLKLVLPLGLDTDSAVKTIRTTDTIDPTNTGGSDTISGNADNDIIAGGVYGDTIYGDRQVPTAVTEANEGDDIILGDNGAFEWLSNGRLGEITGIDISANNLALWAKYGTGAYDNDLSTLDLVTTEQPTSGGRDLIYGDNGRDLVFGGTDADTIYGDDGIEAALPEGYGSADNNDLLFGDHGRIYPQFSTLRGEGQDWRDAFNSRNFFAIDVGDTDSDTLTPDYGGEGDRIWGEEGDDTMLGQQGDDRMFGGSGDDDMTGGHNVSGGIDELTVTTILASLDGAGIEVPAIDDVNDLMDGGTGDDSMAGDNAIIWRRGDDFSPRFRELTADAIYSTTNSTIIANIDSDWQSDPADAIGRDIELVDHSDTTMSGLYGSDVMAGGADSDVMFGQLANDLMQGDGSIGTIADSGPNTETIIVTDTAGTTGDTLYFNIPEAASDGDDYLEGNGGSDLMYGGLGQDDIIGGSSALFGLVTEEMRPDSSDFIFGGAGIDISRNDIGDATEDSETQVITEIDGGHVRDADFIMGDNANVYRLVNAATDEFLTFNYDTYAPDADPNTYDYIIPRAMEQLDYTLGGADYAGGSYTAWGAANADNGAADLIHGESGDDIIFGMTGSDVIFGEGQDDDIVGGYGNDWISGGTGQDGVLGDDGLVLTSRNSTAGEPLYGVAGLAAKDSRPKYADGDVLNEVIYTPGSIQYAVINVEGQLKKSIDLVPFSYDPDWIAIDDEFPDNEDNQPYADDIIFGGLGSDWLHGGSGDDAISGAEALPDAYVPDYSDLDNDGNTDELINLGYTNAGNPANLNLMNPGDVLAFNPEDADGQHLNNRYRAGEFDLYDEYDPRRIILLTQTGELYKDNPESGTESVDYFQFLLNFDETEGVVRPAGEVPKATGQQTETYPQVWDDGRDAIFGDLGNDWLVGGTGADDLYGGWGNDLLNADDDHTTLGEDGITVGANDLPDTHPFYQDRAYGGAGRDILIGNTGGDRLIDWVGEYNSYLVPYAPFGQASVSRTLQPFLPEFLYALSAGDGADFTRPGDTGASELRNGEPDAEMGLVLQKDFAWQDQTGAPADPQAGNIPGGARDVLRSAGFNDGTSDAFFVDSGIWTVVSGRYQVEPTSLGGDALSVFYVDKFIPNYFEMMATIQAVKPIAGYNANAYLVFDYQSSEDFKFAGINVSTSKLEIGYRDASGWHVEVQTPYTGALKANTDYNVFLSLNGNTAILVVNNRITLTYTFESADGTFLNDGMVGLGANNAKAQIDNVVVQRIPPAMTYTRTVDFSDQADVDSLFQDDLAIAGGLHTLTAETGGTAVDLVNMQVAPASVLSLEALFKTSYQGGFVFDYYDTDDFKFVAVDVDNDQVLVGHSTSRTGVVVDASWNMNDTLDLDSDTYYTLGITIAERSVSVTIDGNAALSYAFNALITDGEFGLLARDGAVYFNEFTVRTDDPAYSTPALPTISISDTSVNEGDGTATVWVTLSAPSDEAVSVSYTTVNGSAVVDEDYEYATGTLIFAPGETSRDIELTVFDDGDFEPDETFTVELSNSVNATIADGVGTITIENDDDNPSPALPTISIGDVSVLEGNKTNKTKATVTLTLSEASATPVTVHLATVEGTAVEVEDYVAVTDATITFTPGETEKQYTLIINGDKVYEFNETFNVVLSDPDGATIYDGTGTVTITNDDPAPLMAAETATGSLSEVDLLTQEQLAPIVAEAISRWEAVLGTPIDLGGIDFQIVDFEGRGQGILGQTTPDIIYIDDDAAGWGWYVDENPTTDGEFVVAGGEDAERMDLLTAVMHEIGHALGYSDLPADAEDLMSATLDAGERLNPGDGGDSLVVMDTEDLDANVNEPDLLTKAKAGDSWLVNFLMKKARKDYNPFEPVNGINITIDENEESE